MRYEVYMKRKQLREDLKSILRPLGFFHDQSASSSSDYFGKFDERDERGRSFKARLSDHPQPFRGNFQYELLLLSDVEWPSAEEIAEQIIAAEAVWHG